MPCRKLPIFFRSLCPWLMDGTKANTNVNKSSCFISRLPNEILHWSDNCKLLQSATAFHADLWWRRTDFGQRCLFVTNSNRPHISASCFKEPYTIATYCRCVGFRMSYHLEADTKYLRPLVWACNEMSRQWFPEVAASDQLKSYTETLCQILS